MRHLELYVRKSDGTNYCVATLREDEPNAWNRMDREAQHWLAKPGVLAVSCEPVEGRTGGYR